MSNPGKENPPFCCKGLFNQQSCDSVGQGTERGFSCSHNQPDSAQGRDGFREAGGLRP